MQRRLKTSTFFMQFKEILQVCEGTANIKQFFNFESTKLFVPPGFDKCQGCDKTLSQSSILKHVSKSKNCKRKYGEDGYTFLKEESAKRKKTYQKNYKQIHAKKLRDQHEKYNQVNAKEINMKQAIYDKAHKDENKLRKANYYSQNADKIRQSQSKYNKENAEQIRQNQTKSLIEVLNGRLALEGGIL